MMWYRKHAFPLAEELPLLEKSSRLIRKQKGRTLKQTDYIRRLLSEGEFKPLIRDAVRSQEVPLILLFVAVATVASFVVKYALLGVVVIGIVFAVSISFLRVLESAVRRSVMSTALVVSNQVALLDKDLDLVRSELPRAFIARIVELAGHFDSARRGENEVNEHIVLLQSETKPHKTRAETLEENPLIADQLKLAEGLVRSSKDEFWKFLGYVYDVAIDAHELEMSQFPPKPRTLQEALGLKGWLDIQEMIRRDSLNIPPPA